MSPYWHEADVTSGRWMSAVEGKAEFKKVATGITGATDIEVTDGLNEGDQIVTKTGIIVGMGEEMHELLAVFRDLADRRVDILTIGQYLRPSRDHLPMARYYTPEEFAFLKHEALGMGFKHVESGPLVRSSYHAQEQAESTGLAVNNQK